MPRPKIDTSRVKSVIWNVPTHLARSPTEHTSGYLLNMNTKRILRNLLKRRAIWIALLALSTLVIHNIAVSGISPRQEEAADNYKIDNTHTSMVFAVSHFGLSYTYGRFNEVSGEFALNGGELTTAGFAFSVKADSIDTNNAERDKHLRGPEFFNTEKFPEISFVTTGFDKVNGVLNIKGDLTMLGQTKPMLLPVELVGIGKGPFGAQRAGFFSKFTINRDDFGMNKMAGQIGNKISITFSFEGVKQP